MKILIADNQSKVRYALSILLQKQPEWEIAGSAGDAWDLLTQVAVLHPDVLLLDWNLPGLPLGEVIHHAHQLMGRTPGMAVPPGTGWAGMAKLMVIITSVKPEMRQKALSLGADDFISKVDSPSKLLEVLEMCKSHLPKQKRQ